MRMSPRPCRVTDQLSNRTNAKNN